MTARAASYLTLSFARSALYHCEAIFGRLVASVATALRVPAVAAGRAGMRCAEKPTRPPKSKCLRGSTLVTINNTDNMHEALQPRPEG